MVTVTLPVLLVAVTGGGGEGEGADVERVSRSLNPSAYIVPSGASHRS
ncbi:hypothetical protein HRbin08_01978 [bacterium HR08]|nr:hypothetical protein HRbin08_01978 [bacterium HR08]